ncbi:MAG: hypothetical protein ACI9IJ_002137, partial [Psychromonas sp.]
QKKAQQADKESANNLTSNSEPEHSLE